VNILKVKKRYFLKKKKIKEIKKELGEYGSLINNKDSVELLEVDPNDFVLVNGKPYIIIINNKPYPTLKAALNEDLNAKTVVVDMGAVKFMTNGADVMSPGITEADENIQEGDIVLVVEESHHKPLVIGKSLITGPEMEENDNGKAIETIHYIGDDIWEFEI
jgi:PUA-domain protein